MYAVILALMGFGKVHNLDLCFRKLISADCESGSGVFGVWSGEVLF
jgi:hypothetical protein